MKIINRAEAIEQGLKRYFTGVPCFRGHIDEVYISIDKCVQCKKDDIKKYSLKNKNIINQKNRDRRKNRTKEQIKIASEKKKQWRKDNAEIIKIKNKIYRDNNRDKRLEQSREYDKLNKDKKRIYSKKHREENIDIYRQREQHKRDTQKDSIAKANSKWRLNTIKERREYRTAYSPRRNELDKIWRKTPEGKLVGFCRSGITRVVKIIKQKKNIITLKSLDYNISDLKEHLEKRFDIMMTWNNHGLWHIDHKESLVNLVRIHKDKSQKEIFNIVNALDNLQPLWAIDNLKKGAK